MKKIFFILLIFTSSCGLHKKLCCSLTENLWNEFYKEKIREFVISPDGRNVIFLGNKFHYALEDNTGALKSILLSKYRYFLYVDSGDSFLDLYPNNQIVAYIKVLINTVTPPADAYDYFSSFGFRRQEDGLLFLTASFNGTRYQAVDNLNIYRESLNRVYELKVRSKAGSAADLGKILLTPLAVGADLIILFGRIIIWPLSSN